MRSRTKKIIIVIVILIVAGGAFGVVRYIQSRDQSVDNTSSQDTESTSGPSSNKTSVTELPDGSSEILPSQDALDDRLSQSAVHAGDVEPVKGSVDWSDQKVVLVSYNKSTSLRYLDYSLDYVDGSTAEVTLNLQNPPAGCAYTQVNRMLYQPVVVKQSVNTVRVFVAIQANSQRCPGS